MAAERFMEENGQTRTQYSFVIPVYNEEETLPELHKRLSSLMDRIGGECEAIMVDDGSRDGSLTSMIEINRCDPRFKVIRLSRNFGHQMAITAGMDYCSGDAVVIMDADLQDPPELVLEMVEMWKQGYEMVYAIRKNRQGESWFKRTATFLFYRFLKKLTDLDIPVDVGDFRLVDRKALSAFKGLRETSRYVRGMFSWVGFKQIGIPYVRPGRFAGETKYPFKKLLKLAMDGIFNFSNFPLRLTLKLGFFISAISFLFGLTAIFIKLLGFYAVPGWASLVAIITFLSGLQLSVLGMMGEYIGRIFEEVKGRPLYIVQNLYGFEPISSGQVERIAPLPLRFPPHEGRG